MNIFLLFTNNTNKSKGGAFLMSKKNKQKGNPNTSGDDSNTKK